MSNVKALFIGCNPSLKNTNPDVPFEGTKSGKVLDKWIGLLGLTPDQCTFMNLTKYATQNQAILKKSDVNLDQFKFEVGVSLCAAYHGKDKAFSMVISAYQDAGKLDPEKLVPNKPEEVEADMLLVKETPLAKIVTLGKMATWGFCSLKSDIPSFELPHPSGLNRKVNDKENLAKMLAECKLWLYS